MLKNYWSCLIECFTYTQPKNATSFQFYPLVASCQEVATNLSISSSCNESVKMGFVQHINLKLVETTCSKLVDSKF